MTQKFDVEISIRELLDMLNECPIQLRSFKRNGATQWECDVYVKAAKVGRAYLTEGPGASLDIESGIRKTIQEEAKKYADLCKDKTPEHFIANLASMTRFRDRLRKAARFQILIQEKYHTGRQYTYYACSPTAENLAKVQSQLNKEDRPHVLLNSLLTKPLPPIIRTLI